MKITEKINMDYEGLKQNGPINIVAFGDSVTHGALAIGELDYETVYWNLLRKKILAVRNYVPVNVINAGIGGITASASVERIDSQVLCHKPDLVIVCFGLNDVNGNLEDYLNALATIFERCTQGGAQVIFMTPNMLNTYVADDTAPQHKGYAQQTAHYQVSGKMDMFMSGAVELANKMGITVCDCYAKWKELAKTEDTTLLLANRINHPTRQMHQLFADGLFEAIFGDFEATAGAESTMFKK